MKKTLSIVLAAIMVLAAIPMSGLSENYKIIDFSLDVSAASESDLTFTLNNDGESYCVSSCNNSANGELVIPSTYNGKPVTSIGDDAFYNCGSLTSITIPDSVKSMGTDAFYNCGSLISITLGNGITSISSCAFMYCRELESVTIPDSVTLIGTNAFCACSSLASITLPDSITSIEDAAFEDNAYYNNSSNWEDNVLYIGNHLIKAETDISGSYIIKQGTKCIAESAFSGCNQLTSVTIPDGVTGIGKNAFSGCSGLTSIAIPGSAAVIGQNAFTKCSGLVSATISDGVTSIGSNVFNGCSSLASITLPDSITSIGQNAFLGTAYFDNSSNWENGVLYIGNYLISAKTDISGSNIIKPETKCLADFSFDGCNNLTTVTIPDGVAGIGSYAFRNCGNLASITIPDSVTGIGDYAFYGCGELASIKIPESVTSISAGILYNCRKITSIVIPDSVKNIGKYAFWNCSGLKSITIPESVTEIVNNAFKGCNYELLTIYGFVNSYAEEYAANNSIKFEAVLILPKGAAEIDYINYFVFIDENGIDDLDNFIIPSADVSLEFSKPRSEFKCFGTGSEINVYVGEAVTQEFICIVKGDVDGDSACDVLDVTTVEKIANNRITASPEQIYAANGYVSETIDVTAYQNIVNRALS